MKKKITALLLTAAMVLSLTACGENTEDKEQTMTEGGNVSQSADGQTVISEGTTGGVAETDAPPASDKHYYKTVRISGDMYTLMPGASALLEGAGGLDDKRPTLTINYNTSTGVAESVEFSTYYTYNDFTTEPNEFLERDKETLSGDSELCSRFSNIRTENIGEYTKLSFDIDISTYFTYFDQYVNLYFIESEQNIEGYKDAVFYDVVDGYYDPKPTCEDGDGCFFENITNRRIEWED